MSARGMSVASQVTDLLAAANQDAKLAAIHEGASNLELARDTYLSAATNMMEAVKLEKDPHRLKTMRAQQEAWLDRIGQLKSSIGAGGLGQPPPGIGAQPPPVAAAGGMAPSESTEE
jgi:hypothetical protein